MNKLLLITFLLGYTALHAQDQYPKNPDVDIRHYTFNLVLNDLTNEIQGETIIQALLTEDADHLTLDLIQKNTDEFGMIVTEVLKGNNPVSYTYENDKLNIMLDPGQSTEAEFTIQYRGIPQKGLVISTTKYGTRSFFGDNWPNLARYWLPSVDHPYDKASVTFKIVAPAQYDVVATGKKVEESYLGDGQKLTSYFEPSPVATKVMTIGVTHFASRVLGYSGDTEISAWVYPENRLEGFSDFEVALKVMDYFTENIGPYPWAKLANMQAKTQWGGLENAGTIAYRESSVTGRNEIEGLIAHEIAHQWFGNSATESSWNHVWLSEGFATYFTVLYLEERYGKERRMEEMALDRQQVIEYAGSHASIVVDTTISDPGKVLSTNTYQKGGWVLHMLRRKLGDDVFWKGIRAYYNKYTNSNALTEDFRNVMEEVSGQELKDFFHQWLYADGFPELKTDWNYKNGRLIIEIEQKQKGSLYSFPLDIGLVSGDEMEVRTIEVTGKKQTYEFELPTEPGEVQLDPEVWLLYAESK